MTHGLLEETISTPQAAMHILPLVLPCCPDGIAHTRYAVPQADAANIG